MNFFLKFFELNHFKGILRFFSFLCLCIGVFAFDQGEAPPVFKVKAIEINVESLKTKFHHH
jgi:hypothetical protein